MHKEGGFLGLYAALPASIPLALLPSLTLYIHSVLLRVLVPAKHRAHPPGATTFFLGAISNALATIPLYPLILIKALNQSGSTTTGTSSSSSNASSLGIGNGGSKRNNRSRRQGMLATMKGVIDQKGVIGLYKGIEGQLLKGLVSQGVMMLVKQR
jgi:adenine nucleotide transporter 17